jgi:alpha-N-arabinofuranosidase
MAIPEFILRKLIVPGSLKSSGNGFQFILLDTFAPATITSFALFVGDASISMADITISQDKLESYTADHVNKETPLNAAIGVEISISIKNHPLNGPVKVSVDTKEVGTLEFTLADSIKKPHYSSFKPAWTAKFTRPIETSIQINTEHPLGQASPFLLGQFVEHLECCVYDGIWTKDGSALREDTLELLKKLQIPMIRYPGGNFASGYHWEDGIGPKSGRPTRHDAAWHAEESNLIGTDEFLTFCEQMDIEPYLVVNDGSGTPEEAARWVAYCNDPETTEQGRRRAANGHEAAYNVKYWGIGNEVWGPWQIGTTSAQEYARRLKRFSQAMKTVDPTIKIIAVGNNPLSDDPQDAGAQWNTEVLKDAASSFDYLSWHIYQPEQDSWKETYDPQSLFASVCAAPIDFENIIHRTNLEIEQSAGKGRITQCIDEWNIWLPPEKTAKSMHQVTYTMRDALYVAGIINVLFRNYDKVDIANLAQLVNVLPLIKTNTTTAIATAIYYPFVLASELEDCILGVKVDSPTFNSEAIGNNVLSHNDVPYLDVVATKSEDSGNIALLLINRHPEKRMHVILDFSDEMDFTATALKEIYANSPLAANTFTHPHAVRIHDRNNVVKVGNQYHLTLAPASVNLCKFEK